MSKSPRCYVDAVQCMRHDSEIGSDRLDRIEGQQSTSCRPWGILGHELTIVPPASSPWWGACEGSVGDEDGRTDGMGGRTSMTLLPDIVQEVDGWKGRLGERVRLAKSAVRHWLQCLLSAVTFWCWLAVSELQGPYSAGLAGRSFHI